MAGVDMCIEDLEQYRGTNPKPEDFEKYWENALMEMKEVEADVVLEKAKFQSPVADCFELYFSGTKGARIHAKYLRPKQKAEKVPAVLRFHGYRRDSGDWTSHLAYAASGVAVFAMDVRGQGGLSQDVGGVWGNTLNGHIIRGLRDEDPNKLFFRDVFLDAAKLAGIAMDFSEIDETKVYAYGGSQGGGIALACAALEPRVAKVAVQNPFLNDYKRVWDMNLDANSYEELREYFRRVDPRHEKIEEIFTKLGYIDVQNLTSRIQADVLMFTGLMDYICPPSTQYAAYNKMTCNKKHILYQDYGHEEFIDMEDIVYDFLVNNKY